jgi:hypothetical protein
MTPISQITSIVEQYYDLSSGSCQVKTRKREICQARQIAMYFAKKYTKLSNTEIGWQIGMKDHSTTIHARKTITDLNETDPDFRMQLSEIDGYIKAVILPDNAINLKIQAVLTLKDCQYQLGWSYSFKGQIKQSKSKIVKVDCDSIYEAMTGFDITEVEKLTVEIVNNPVVSTVPVPENEIVEIILSESVSE